MHVREQRRPPGTRRASAIDLDAAAGDGHGPALPPAAFQEGHHGRAPVGPLASVRHVLRQRSAQPRQGFRRCEQLRHASVRRHRRRFRHHLERLPHTFGRPDRCRLRHGSGLQRFTPVSRHPFISQPNPCLCLSYQIGSHFMTSTEKIEMASNIRLHPAERAVCMAIFNGIPSSISTG